MRTSTRPKLVLSILALTLLCGAMVLGVEASDLTTPTAASAESADCPPLTPSVVSNEYFEVVDARTVQFHDGVDFELVEDASGNMVLEYWAKDASTGSIAPIEEVQKLTCACRPGCYGECDVTVVFPFLALCTGECQRHEPGDCRPCKFR